MPLRSDPSLWFNLPGVAAAYQPVRAPDSLSARYNMAHGGDNRYRAVPGMLPAWSWVAGWTFNGSTQHLLTGLSPTSDAAWSALVRFSGAPDETESALIGATSSLMISPGWWGTVRYYYAGGVTQSPRAAAGVLGIAGRSAYRDGALDATWTAGAWFDGELAIGAALVSGTVQWHIAASIQAIAIYTRTLSAAEMWLASQQMKYFNPAWSVWGRRRQYYYAPTAAFQAAWAERANRLIGGG